MEVLNPDLYEKAKKIVYAKYKTHGAYRSGALVQLYKRMGGRYAGNRQKGKLKRWFDEKWQDIGGKEYPVFRPTVRVNEQTPLTPNEIPKENLQKQINLKQKYKNKYNLSPFIRK